MGRLNTLALVFLALTGGYYYGLTESAPQTTFVDSTADPIPHSVQMLDETVERNVSDLGTVRWLDHTSPYGRGISVGLVSNGSANQTARAVLQQVPRLARDTPLRTLQLWVRGDRGDGSVITVTINESSTSRLRSGEWSRSDYWQSIQGKKRVYFENRSYEDRHWEPAGEMEVDG
jgi:hypothetical protein